MSGHAADGSCAVADAMRQFAIELGVPGDRIIVERESDSTRENAGRVAPLLHARNADRLLLVTDKLHMRRSRAVFRHFGFAVEPISVPVYEGRADNVAMLAAAAREAVSIAYYTARGWMRPNANTRDNAGHPEKGAPEYAGEVSNPAGPIVILGASYAGSWPLGSVDGIPVINAGVAGQRTRQMLERFDRDVVAKRPRAVLIWGFINDLFSADDPRQANDGVRAAYQEMIARARAAGIEPIVATEITARSPGGIMNSARALLGTALGKTSYFDRINEHVMSVNGWLLELARTEGLLVCDLQAATALSSVTPLPKRSSGRTVSSCRTQGSSRIKVIQCCGSTSLAQVTALACSRNPVLTRHALISVGR
jgi:hypothetical protein